MRRKKERKPIQVCIVDLAADMVDRCLINASLNRPSTKESKRKEFLSICGYFFSLNKAKSLIIAKIPFL